MAGHIEGGLSAARRGHLNCLLQLGHLQALLAGVDGWMTRCPGELLLTLSPFCLNRSHLGAKAFPPNACVGCSSKRLGDGGFCLAARIPSACLV